MATKVRTGTVKSITKSGATGLTRVVRMCFTPPDPCEDVLFHDVPESYYDDLRAAKHAGGDVTMTYDDATLTMSAVTT